jgi:hypothetical protein
MMNKFLSLLAGFERIFATISANPPLLSYRLRQSTIKPFHHPVRLRTKGSRQLMLYPVCCANAVKCMIS